MAFDYKSFANELGLADEDKTTLFGLFEKNPTVVTKLESVLTSQVDARLAPLQAELAAKQTDLDAQFDTLASIRGGDASAIEAAEKRAEKLASERAILEARFRSVATQNGIDADEILKDLSLTPVKPVEKPVVQTTLDADAILRSANLSALNAAEQAFLMEDLASRHRQLFGTEMSRGELWKTFKETVKRTQNPDLRLETVFETHFNVKAKEAELSEAAVQRRITTAIEADRVARADEAALRMTNQPAEVFDPKSPVFAAVSKDARPAAMGGIPDGVVASMKAWQERKRAS